MNILLIITSHYYSIKSDLIYYTTLISEEEVLLCAMSLSRTCFQHILLRFRDENGFNGHKHINKKIILD